MGIFGSKSKKAAASQTNKKPTHNNSTNWQRSSRTNATSQTYNVRFQGMVEALRLMVADSFLTNSQPAFQEPTRYPVTDWPKGLRIETLYIDLEKGSAEAVTIDGVTLNPPIPFDKLARFLNDHVQGGVENLVFNGSNGLQGVLLQVLNTVTVPARLHSGMLSFADFHSLPWPTIQRIFDGRTLRPEAIRFTRLRLPRGVDANKLLELPAVCGCSHLNLKLYNASLPQLPGRPPLFDSASLVEWIKGSYNRELDITSDYLSSGLDSFLDAIVKDFEEATQVHFYRVSIKCPNIKTIVAGERKRDEAFSNRLGETMVIHIRKDRSAAKVMGDVEAFDVVSVARLTLS